MSSFERHELPIRQSRCEVQSQSSEGRRTCTEHFPIFAEDDRAGKERAARYFRAAGQPWGRGQISGVPEPVRNEDEGGDGEGTSRPSSIYAPAIFLTSSWAARIVVWHVARQTSADAIPESRLWLSGPFLLAALYGFPLPDHCGYRRRLPCGVQTQLKTCFTNHWSVARTPSG